MTWYIYNQRVRREIRMIRQMIQIDEEKCNGCGLCVGACHESALALVDGKAKLIRDDYCDGLGNCLPACPTGAITFVQREAAAFNKEEVEKNMKQAAATTAPMHGGCPGSMAKAIHHTEEPVAEEPVAAAPVVGKPVSRLNQWPVQIKLVPVNAPYFQNANLLIAADCTAYSYGNFHEDFMKNKVTIVGCPKLDMVDYAEKLTEILKNNDIKSLTVVRMEVPCCGGIVSAVKDALLASGKMIPWQVVVLSTEGEILE